jgi:hypothetical protein
MPTRALTWHGMIPTRSDTKSEVWSNNEAATKAFRGGATLCAINHVWDCKYCISVVTSTDCVCNICRAVLLWGPQTFPANRPLSIATHLIVVWAQLITLLPCMKHPPHFDITLLLPHTPCNLPHAYTSVLYVAWLYQCLFWIMSTPLRAVPW